MTSQAVVVGAGIAGLAAATSLARAGWRVTVLERAPELSEVGAGFAMSRNAVAAVRGLGLDDDDVAGLGFPTYAAGTWDLHGAPILTISDKPEVRSAVALIGVHRVRLHEALQRHAAAAGVEVITGERVTDVEPGDPHGSRANVAGHEADLVVAADGMHSALRARLVPRTTARYSGYSSWRAITPGRFGDGALRQYWGPHAEFGTMPVSDTHTYWYGYVAMPERSTFPDEHAAATERFADWAAPVREIIAATPPSALLRHDVHHLPGGLPRYDAGRVVFIGDAAHGFLPTMGQGAATALEDGLCVGLLIGAPVTDGADLARALRAFDEQRRPRCRALGRASLASARIGAHLGGGWRQSVRNTLMRRVPSSLIQRGSQAAMGWTPPATGPQS